MKVKRLLLVCFYFIAGFAFAKEVTTFNKLGLATDGGDTPPSPNWDMHSCI